MKERSREPAGQRLVNFVDNLNDLVNEFNQPPIGCVAYEDVKRHKGTKAAHWYGAFKYRLAEWCRRRKIIVVPVDVGTIKRFATGSGKADKQMMIAAANKRWGVNVTDDNEADALFVAETAFANGLWTT